MSPSSLSTHSHIYYLELVTVVTVSPFASLTDPQKNKHSVSPSTMALLPKSMLTHKIGVSDPSLLIFSSVAQTTALLSSHYIIEIFLIWS